MKITNNNKKKLIWGLILAIFVVIIIVIIIIFMNHSKLNNSNSIIKENNTDSKVIESEKKTEKSKTIHMVAMGDMLAHDTIIVNATNETSYNFGYFFKNIRPIYNNAEIVFCDQEGLSSGENYGISGYPSFNAPTEFASGLQSGAGCNFINLANNHIGDKGINATNATIDLWTSLKPKAISGANKSIEDQQKVSYVTINDIKVSFLAFTDFNNNKSTPSYSVNIYHDEELVRKLVSEARQNSDLVIVSMHWGIEDSNFVSVDQQKQTELLASLGVDIIIGTGPHVLQKAEIITRPDSGRMVVWYSLGNMLSSQLNIKQLIGGIAKMDIIKDNNGLITVNNLSFVPTYMHYEWTAQQSANNDLLARHNAMIYLLKESAQPLSRSLFNTTVEEQRQYVVDIIGTEVVIE